MDSLGQRDGSRYSASTSAPSRPHAGVHEHPASTPCPTHPVAAAGRAPASVDAVTGRSGPRRSLRPATRRGPRSVAGPRHQDDSSAVSSSGAVRRPSLHGAPLQPPANSASATSTAHPGWATGAATSPSAPPRPVAGHRSIGRTTPAHGAPRPDAAGRCVAGSAPVPRRHPSGSRSRGSQPALPVPGCSRRRERRAHGAGIDAPDPVQAARAAALPAPASDAGGRPARGGDPGDRVLDPAATSPPYRGRWTGPSRCRSARQVGAGPCRTTPSGPAAPVSRQVRGGQLPAPRSSASSIRSVPVPAADDLPGRRRRRPQAGSAGLVAAHQLPARRRRPATACRPAAVTPPSGSARRTWSRRPVLPPRQRRLARAGTLKSDAIASWMSRAATITDNRTS